MSNPFVYCFLMIYAFLQSVQHIYVFYHSRFPEFVIFVFHDERYYIDKCDILIIQLEKVRVYLLIWFLLFGIWYLHRSTLCIFVGNLIPWQKLVKASRISWLPLCASHSKLSKFNVQINSIRGQFPRVLFLKLNLENLEQ